MAQRLFFPRQQVFSDLGAIGAGFKLYTYETGTTTPLATYSDTALSVPNANPTIADSAGRFGDIFINDAKLYKAVLKDADDNTIYTADPIDPKTFALSDFDPQPTSFWGTTSGTASAYTLDSNVDITTYSSNDTFFFACHTDCNASPTMAIDGLTALKLKKYDGTGSKVALEASDILSVQRYEATNDGTDIIILNPEKPYFDGRNIFVATSTVKGVVFSPKQITMSNGTDTDHDIDFTAGNFQFDDGSGQAVLSTPLTKQFDATFALGNNVGGMAEGVTLPTDGTVHVFQISNADGTVADIIGDTDINATNVLADSVVVANSLTKKKRLASFVTDGSANIRTGKYLFFKDGSYQFIYNSAVQQLSGSGTYPLTLTDLTIATPIGIKVSPSFDCLVQSVGTDGIAIADYDTSTEYKICTCANTVATGSLASGALYTNTNSQVKYRNSGITGLVDFDFNIKLCGWKDNNL
jgi:hypothetical protein